jgi:hypothetical protein
MANGAKNGHAISLPDSSVPSTTMTIKGVEGLCDQPCLVSRAA